MHVKKRMCLVNTILLVLTFTALTSCGKQERQRLEVQVDSLKQVISVQQVDMNEMTASLDLVANGLDSIHQQENLIYMGRDEVTGKKLTRQELKERIRNLAKLISRQKERITALEDSLSFNSNKQFKSLKIVIANLNAQLEEKERTIEDLNKQIASQQVSIDKLRQSNTELEEHITNLDGALQAQDEMINEGYYIIGTRKELKEAGVVSAKFLKKSKVNMSVSDLSKLKKIDIRNFPDEMKIDAKKAVILSHMPEASYSWVYGGNQSILYIKDPALFWSISKILVIQKSDNILDRI